MIVANIKMTNIFGAMDGIVKEAQFWTLLKQSSSNAGRKTVLAIMEGV